MESKQKQLNMKHILPLIIAMTMGILIQAQDFQGVAYYQSKTSMDMGEFGGRQMSPEMKKRIAENMKSMLEKTYILAFNQSESVFSEEEVLEAPGSGRNWMSWMNNYSAGPQYKNIKESQLVQDQEFFGKQFLINDSLQSFEWQMGTETRQIGSYLCFKATAVKKVADSDWASMRRRTNRDQTNKVDADSTKTTVVSDDLEMPKEVIVTAWYTPQIPVSHGPGEFWGLPGLILEVQNDRTTILCSKIVMNPAQKSKIQAPTKGQKVTRSEYDDIVKKKTEEMRDMYRGGGRGRGRN
jgi:GLPGLI family protein